jgi:DNA-binding transcriptional regulator YhcF (GntR family)
MRQKTRVLSYMKRMITSNKWEEKLPSTTSIATKLATSAVTVRNCLRILEAQNVIENNGTIGYFVIPKKFAELYSTNKQLYYLTMLQRNILIAKLIDDGGNMFGNYIIKQENDALKVANVSSGEIINTSKKELFDSVRNPITTDILICKSGKDLNDTRTLFLKQKKLVPIFTAIKTSTKRFEING